MNGALLLAAGCLLALAGGLGLAAFRNRRATGLPAGARVVYSDSDGWQEVVRPLFSARYGLTGKPDYIVKTRRGLVPVELKPLRNAEQPYEGDILQLAAYCLLLEDVWQARPPYGLLRYRARTYRVEWTDQLRELLLLTLEDMRELSDYPARQGQPMPAPNHSMTARCRPCGFHYICYPEKN